MSDSTLPPDDAKKLLHEPTSTLEPTADFAVGYSRPPKSAQFKKGRSGNPRGRPKGRKNLRTLFVKELDTKVSIRIGDELRTVSKAQAIAKRAVHQAMQGEPRAIATVIGIDRETDQAETKRDTEQKFGVLRVNRPSLTLEECVARNKVEGYLTTLADIEELEHSQALQIVEFKKRVIEREKAQAKEAQEKLALTR